MKKKIPDAFVIVFLLIVFAALLTFVVPGGSFERQKVKIEGTTRELVVPGSFKYEASRPQLLQIFTAPIEGFMKLSEIIVFIFFVGGAFNIVYQTGVFTAGIYRLVKLLKGKEFLIIPIVMFIFSFFGAVFGMCEEAMPFVMIFVPLAIALGYDSLVGVSLTFVAAGVGFAGAFINPFTLQIAQGISGIQPLSGMGYRVLVWLVCTTFTVVWVMVYAAKIKKDPTKSPMYEIDQQKREELTQQEPVELTASHIVCMAVFLLFTVAMIVGVIVLKWYIVELAALFLGMGILCGLVSRMDMNAISRSFVAGCKDIAGAAIIVGFAGGIVFILQQGRIIDTILYAASVVTSKMPGILAADVMYFIQMAVNFFIPSGSTKAALTMPIMAPLADLSGITRQTAVLAYQFGDGFTNMIIPTSGVTIGTLSMARIPYDRWVRWHYPLQIAFFVLSILLLIWPVLSGWN